jgi:LmbE family N-acetylglucosaminyl deacetylase
VLTDAVFNAGLRRYETGIDAWKAEWVCQYFINDSTTPSFVVDVSDHYQRKRDALACHRSQFSAQADGAVATRLTSPLFLQLVESRDAQFGAQAGVPFAEGVVVPGPLIRGDLFKSAARRDAGSR